LQSGYLLFALLPRLTCLECAGCPWRSQRGQPATAPG
jgi:hypothetical protein